MSGSGSKWTRLTVAAFLVVPAFVLSAAVTSTAAPTQQQVEAAKQRLAQLQTHFENAVEAWNTAKYDLQQVQSKLADAKAMRDAAERDAARARDALAKRAVEAYTGMGSDLDMLLGAQNFNEFSDRLEFMGQIAQSDTDLAATADAARQRADWAAQQYAHLETVRYDPGAGPEDTGADVWVVAPWSLPRQAAAGALLPAPEALTARDAPRRVDRAAPAEPVGGGVAELLDDTGGAPPDRIAIAARRPVGRAGHLITLGRLGEVLEQQPLRLAVDVDDAEEAW